MGRLFRMNSSEDKDIGLKGWLRGKVPKVKPQESTAGQVVLDKHRIAVLPFVNMSPDPADEYFADGMTKEIIAAVSSARTVLPSESFFPPRAMKANAESGRSFMYFVVHSAALKTI